MDFKHRRTVVECRPATIAGNAVKAGAVGAAEADGVDAVAKPAVVAKTQIGRRESKCTAPPVAGGHLTDHEPAIAKKLICRTDIALCEMGADAG